MTTPTSMDDCYFYYYSSCTKGDECPYRHCELALGTETVCSLWKEGRCLRSNCKFRHMESRINRSTIACYWENQPGGCRKPHCVFLHRKLRNGIQSAKTTQELILPTVDGKVSPKLPDAIEVVVQSNSSPKQSTPESADYVPDPSSVPVTPLVLSFDAGEESDNESVSSTPVKIGSNDTKIDTSTVIRNNLSSKFSGKEEKDFGIKTLEQIRMEKIHKESDSFYSSAYKDISLDKTQTGEQVAKEYYPPKTEFLSISKDPILEKSLPVPPKETKLAVLEEESDLRERLSNRRNLPSNKVNSAKRLISFKKQNNKVEVAENPGLLNFKIKTLEEIRKEKESKQVNPLPVSNNSSVSSSSGEESKSSGSTTQKTTRRLKITRKPKELYSVPAIRQLANGIQNAPETKEQLSAIISCSDTSPSVQELTNSPGKRKAIDNIEKETKILKLDASDPDNASEDTNCVKESMLLTNENHVKSLQCFLRRPKIQALAVADDTPYIESSSVLSTSSQDDKPASVVDEGNAGMESDMVPEPTVDFCNASTVAQSEPSMLVDNVKEEKSGLAIDRSESVDEFGILLDDEDDMNMDDIEAEADDDILLEVEQFLDS